MSHRAAHAYWQAFEESRERLPEAFREAKSEGWRYRCLLGFAALDNEMTFRFRDIEWAEMSSYLKAFLNEPARLSIRIEQTPNLFSRAQWFATLRFLANLQEPQRFQPTLADVAVLIAMNAPDDQVPEESLELLRLHRIRGEILSTAKTPSETELFEAVKALEAKRKRETVAGLPSSENKIAA